MNEYRDSLPWFPDEVKNLPEPWRNIYADQNEKALPVTRETVAAALDILQRTLVAYPRIPDPPFPGDFPSYLIDMWSLMATGILARQLRTLDAVSPGPLMPTLERNYPQYTEQDVDRLMQGWVHDNVGSIMLRALNWLNVSISALGDVASVESFIAIARASWLEHDSRMIGKLITLAFRFSREVNQPELAIPFLDEVIHDVRTPQRNRDWARTLCRELRELAGQTPA